MRIAPPPSMPPESSDWTAPPAAACRMCTVSMENSLESRCFPTSRDLVNGNLHGLAVEQTLGEVDGGCALGLGSFHPNAEFPMPQHAGHDGNQNRPKRDQNGGEDEEQGGEEEQDSAPQAGHPCPQFSHHLPCKALEGDEATDGEGDLGQVVLDNPTLSRAGRSRSISAPRSSLLGGVVSRVRSKRPVQRRPNGRRST